MPGYDHEKRQKLLSKLGKHNLGKCCLTFKRLTDVDTKVLEQIIKSAWDSLAEKHPLEGDGSAVASSSTSKKKSASTKRKAAPASKGKAKQKKQRTTKAAPAKKASKKGAKTKRKKK